MDIDKVMVVGGGTLGSQIAWQTAFSGFEVVVYDNHEDSLARCRDFHAAYARTFVDELGKDAADVEAAQRRLTYTTDIEEACRDADLVSESVPENPDIKTAVWSMIGKHIPKHCLLTTNSSTMLPSMFADATGDPSRFCALHFANPIWIGNIGEVMRHPGTDDAVFERVLEFARQIGMVPIRIEKEQPGYVINTLLVPFLTAGMSLVVNGVASVEDVDRVWMISTQAPMGPMAWVDLVGMVTAFNVSMLLAEADDGSTSEIAKKNAAYLKEHFLDKGHLGRSTGKGFYTYPNPAFEQEGFLTGEDLLQGQD